MQGGNCGLVRQKTTAFALAPFNIHMPTVGRGSVGNVRVCWAPVIQAWLGCGLGCATRGDSPAKSPAQIQGSWATDTSLGLSRGCFSD